jgi:AhpC/TSA family
MPPAPDWAVQTWFNTPQPLTLAGLRGKVVVLCAFQALCPKSASAGIPQAIRVHDAFSPDDVAVIGLHATFEHHAAISVSLLSAFIHEYRIKFPVALDLSSEQGPIPQTMERYKMRGTPSLVLIDRVGRIRKHSFGAGDDLRLGAEIGALTQEHRLSAELPHSSAA